MKRLPAPHALIGWIGFAAFALTQGAACTKKADPTGLVIEVQSDLIPGVDLDEVYVEFTRKETGSMSFPLGNQPEQRRFPLVFSLRPAQAGDEPFTVQVIGRKLQRAKVQTGVRTSFAPGKIPVLTIRLDRACVDVTCSEELPSCSMGRCEAIPEVRPDDLPPFQPAIPEEGRVDGRVDGGAGGGGAHDGGPDAPSPTVDGGTCPEGESRACSCGMTAGGKQICQAGVWGACRSSCANGGMVGKCSDGTRPCDESTGLWGACSIAPAAKDSCAPDNDDDCNGVKNEGCGCVQGATRTCSDGGLFGKCAAGAQTCTAEGKWGACSIAPAAKDTCAKDNDDNCNGVKNEGCPCSTGSTRKCSDGGLMGKCSSGMQSCGADAQWSACSITPGAKDTCAPGNDDNCNGMLNEGCACVQGATRKCSDGGLMGKCAGGMQTCGAAGTWGACSIAPSASDTCVSDNDDNCNGIRNEGCKCLLGQSRACSAAGLMGRCAAGTQVCDGSGAWGACSIAPAGADRCDPGNDDNCNGRPNEGCACTNGMSRPCSQSSPPLLGKCAAGTQTCMNGGWTECSVRPSAKDSCDAGNDDTCNGKANEGCPCTNGSTRKCSEGGLVGKCASGDQVCSAGAWGACSVTASAKDTCAEGNNDDCKGLPNEGCTCVVGTTQPCAGAKGSCAAGTQTCVAPGTWSACSVAARSKDNCTALPYTDDNCNGTVDCECTDGTSTACNQCDDVKTCTDGRWSACPGTSAPQLWYLDRDNDRYGDAFTFYRSCTGVTPGPGYIAQGGDYCDTDGNAYPGSLVSSSVPTLCSNYDYNQDGDETIVDGTGVADCRSGPGQPHQGGWSSAPMCGDVNTYCYCICDEWEDCHSPCDAAESIRCY